MTDLKRVIVYFTEEEKAEIESLAQVMGQSMSSLVGDLVKESLPAMRAVCKAIVVAKSDPSEALKMLRAAGYDAQTDLITFGKSLDQGS